MVDREQHTSRAILVSFKPYSRSASIISCGLGARDCSNWGIMSPIGAILSFCGAPHPLYLGLGCAPFLQRRRPFLTCRCIGVLVISGMLPFCGCGCVPSGGATGRAVRAQSERVGIFRQDDGSNLTAFRAVEPHELAPGCWVRLAWGLAVRIG
jgi:hypothetical protein